MTVSLRQVCAALGHSGSVSLCSDILGFRAGRMPTQVLPTRPRPVISISGFVGLLRQQHFHVRMIVAGSDLLTSDDEDVVDYAVFRLRDIYAGNDIGIGIVMSDLRSAADSLGHATVANSGDITATGHDLTADGDFVPVVIPASMTVQTMNADGTITVTLGRSPTPGPCTPRNLAGMNSSVIDISGEETGRTLAHEVGHFLGADHPATPGTNLMAQTGAVAGDPFVATDIIASDRTIMRGHCVMRPALTGF